MPTKLTTPTADICLYGNRTAGFDWLASHNGRLIEGGYDPERGLRFGTITESIWAAQDALTADGAEGDVWIHAPGGELRARARLGEIPSAGSLRWEAALPAIIITAEQAEAAAEATR